MCLEINASKGMFLKTCDCNWRCDIEKKKHIAFLLEVCVLRFACNAIFSLIRHSTKYLH